MLLAVTSPLSIISNIKDIIVAVMLSFCLAFYHAFYHAFYNYILLHQLMLIEEWRYHFFENPMMSNEKKMAGVTFDSDIEVEISEFVTGIINEWVEQGMPLTEIGLSCGITDNGSVIFKAKGADGQSKSYTVPPGKWGYIEVCADTFIAPGLPSRYH